MSQLDALLDRSRSPGSFVERRTFTLSREKAIGKLREFALRNPREYVLELIQSAVFSGATYIAVDVEESRCTVAWVGGKPFTERQLSALFDHLFLDRNDLEHRPVVQLAVALNALLQRKPRKLRIESGSGRDDETVRIDLDRHGKGVLGVPEDALAGTYVTAEFGWGWFDRFGDDDPTVEEALIEERCRHSPVPILLNGRAPFGYRSSRKLSMVGCPHFLPFDDGDRHGVVAVPPRTPSAWGFALVVGGVRITTVDLPELGYVPAGIGGREDPTPLAGVVVDDTLLKTADHSDIVRERRFAEMLHAVQPHATELIRALARGEYEPPALPELVGGAKVAEPIPELIEQLGPRPAFPSAALAAVPEGTPVFRVRPQDAEALVESTRPDRFPHPVLLVPDRQVIALEEAAPQLSIHGLGSPAEVALVDRMLERRVSQREHVVSYTDPEDPARVGTLRLQLHVSGPAPLLADPTAGDVSVLIASNGRVERCEATPLGLPRVSAHLDLGRADLPPEDIPLAGLDQALLDGAWGLVGDGRTDAEQDLLAALLAAHMQPHFVVRDGETTLEIGFPDTVGAEIDRYGRLPLAPREEGHLSFDDLVAMMGTEEVCPVAHEFIERLGPLEEKLGAGHLTSPELALSAVVAVGRGRFGWSPLDDLKRPGRRRQRLVWVCPCRGPAFSAEGWTFVDLGLPFVGAAVRDGTTEGEADWEPGLLELLRKLLRMLTPDASSVPPRDRGALRMAALHVALELNRIYYEPLLEALGDATFQTLDELRARAGYSAWPRHGPVVLQHGVVQLYLDELRVIERTGAIPVRYDDPPEVWNSLADPGSTGWLARREVQIYGIHGWLGLRLPYDPTAGVFMQAEGVRIALPDVDRRLPCHGLLRNLGGATQVTDTQRQQLLLERDRLYSYLVDLRDHRDDATREAAEQYLQLYRTAQVAIEPPPRPRRATVTADRIAANTEQMRERIIEASGGILEGVLTVITAELGTPEDALVRIRVHAGRAHVLINRRNPIGHAAATRAGRAREIVLMEIARHLAWWSAGKDFAFDLLQAQCILVAQRLDWPEGGGT